MADTLVLNRSFYAVHVSDWQKAVTLLYTGHAKAVDENLITYDFNDWVELSKLMEKNGKGFVHTSSLRIAVPEVIQLTRYDKLPRQEVKFSRRNVLEHYNFQCCYCGKRFTKSTKSSKEELPEWNLDHVIPRSKGGKSNWDNIVLACLPCNSIKDDKLLGDVIYPKGHPRAGQPMTLKVKPHRPEWKGSRTLVSTNAIIPVSWQRLIDAKYWESELDP